MDWWILELIFVGIMLIALAVLGPFIKRFGRAYAADVFQANPRTGKSYLVLMDIAYYLIFGAYILFVIKWEPDSGWADQVNAAQFQASVVRLGGMLLLMGLLHGLNVLSLPAHRPRFHAEPPARPGRSPVGTGGDIDRRMRSVAGSGATPAGRMKPGPPAWRSSTG